MLNHRLYIPTVSIGIHNLWLNNNQTLFYIDAFWEALLERVFKHLKTEKKSYPQLQKQEWAIKVALNAEGLHESESYINALSLKVDRVMANAINSILNAVDQYYNLHLLKSKCSAVSSLWLAMFEEMELVLDVASGVDNISSDHGNAVFASFNCHFPFFWLFVNCIENQWKLSAVKSK